MGHISFVRILCFKYCILPLGLPLVAQWAHGQIAKLRSVKFFESKLILFHSILKVKSSNIEILKHFEF